MEPHQIASIMLLMNISAAYVFHTILKPRPGSQRETKTARSMAVTMITLNVAFLATLNILEPPVPVILIGSLIAGYALGKFIREMHRVFKRSETPPGKPG